jgi:hypothetical protein
MSWSQITSNQEVTFNNLQDAVSTGVFTAKASIPASQKLITKTEANTYVYINTNYPPYLAKASNQLVVKGDLESNPPVTTTTTTSIAPIYSSRIYGIDQYSTNSYGWPTQGLIRYSDDGGLTWPYLVVTGGSTPGATSVSRNNTGQYVLYGIQDYVSVSNNFGTNFTSSSLAGEYYIEGTAMSNSGQNMYAIGSRLVATPSDNSPSPAIYKSTDYGVNWSLAYTYPRAAFQYQEPYPYNKIATSGNGQYILGTWGGWSKGSFNWGCSFMRSTNYGVSFSRTDFNDSYITDVAVSDTGQYQIMSKMSAFGSGNIKGQGALYWSNNFGGGFATKIYEENFRALYCAMSASGQYMVVAYMNTTDTVNRIYSSSDFGVTWGYTGINPTPPLRGPMPGGVYVAPDGSYALITFVGWSEILYTTDFFNFIIVSISPQSYKFGGLNKSRL